MSRLDQWISKLLLPMSVVSALGLAAPCQALESATVTRVERAASSKVSPRFFSLDQVVKTTLVKGANSDDRSVSAERLQKQGSGRQASQLFAERGFALFLSTESTLDREWGRVIARWRAEAATLDRCEGLPSRCDNPPARAFLQIVAEARNLAANAKVKLLNARVNASVTYVSDEENHGTPDYWASPLETLAKGGDCEDYAILKYFALLRAGMPIDSMAIVLVRDEDVGEDHAVLAVKLDTGWQLLDNRWDELTAAAASTRYEPRYTVTLAKVEMFAAPLELATLRSGIYADRLTPGTGSTR